MPNPNASGKSDCARMRFTSGSASVATRSRAPVTPSREITYRNPLPIAGDELNKNVVLFANNPIWRGETIGSYFLVFNTILNYDNLDAGRALGHR